jgi:hypothetical protein
MSRAHARVIVTQGDLRAYGARARLQEVSVGEAYEVAVECLARYRKTQLRPDPGRFTASERDSRKLRF